MRLTVPLYDARPTLHVATPSLVVRSFVHSFIRCSFVLLGHTLLHVYALLCLAITCSIHVRVSWVVLALGDTGWRGKPLHRA